MGYIGNNSVVQQFTPGADRFSGDDSTVAFTLSRPVGSVFDIQVSVDNVIQDPYSAYSVNNQTLTFTGTPPTGSYNIQVVYRSLVTQNIKPGAGTITTESFSGQAIQNVAIGSTTASTGAFTNLSALGNTVISVTDNTNAALRITQLGTGNALVVEDSSNPDASPFVINNDGLLLHGFTASTNSLGYAQGAQFYRTSGTIGQLRFSTDNGASELVSSKARGSTSSPTVVSNGDGLWLGRFAGYDGTNYIEGVRISAEVDGTPGTNDMPGRLIFFTTADGASSPTERMRITSGGSVLFGTAATTNFIDRVRVVGDTNGVDLGGSASTGSIRIRGSDTGAGLVDFTRLSTDPNNSPFYQGRIFYSFNTNHMSFATNGGERMRIDSSGNLGIGTTSPNARLHVTEDNKIFDSYGNINVFSSTATATDAGGAIAFGGRNSQGTDPYVFGKIKGAKESGGTWNGYLAFGTTASTSAIIERMRLDSLGNLGLGVTPSAWQSTFRALQIGSGTSLYNNASGNGTFLGSNFFWNGTNNLYLSSTTASAYGQTSGQHQWFNAPSGTAGNAISFTQAMTLHASGGLSLGNTTDPGARNLSVTGTGLFQPVTSTDAISVSVKNGGNQLSIGIDNSAGGAYGLGAYSVNYYTTNAYPQTWWINGAARMTLDGSGRLGIGTSSPSHNLSVFASSGDIASFTRDLATDVSLNVSADNDGTILSTGGVHNFRVFTNNAESMRITSTGNVGIGLTNPSTYGAKLFVNGGNIIAEFDRSIGFQWTGGVNQYYKGISGSNQSSSLARGLHLFNYDNDASQGIQLWGGTFSSRSRLAGFSNDGTFEFNSGYGSAAVAYGCRAWVNFNGSGTVSIRANGNVSSITDNGQGDYTVNFSAAMPDTNYTVTGGVKPPSGFTSTTSRTVHVKNDSTIATSSVRVVTPTAGSGYEDFEYVYVLIHR